MTTPCLCPKCDPDAEGELREALAVYYGQIESSPEELIEAIEIINENKAWIHAYGLEVA